jgi:alpha-galactosidase
MVVRAAEALNSSGLLNFGYNRVNLDDWYAVRDGDSGKIKGSPHNFPSGMAAISEKVHAAGCLFGVYSAASMRTCGNWSASLFNEVNDANTFANDWKIDMLKYDACRYNFGVTSRPRYEAMGRALNATGRKILYSVEGWSPETDSTWGPEIADSWRTGSDIWPNWDNHNVCILNNLYQTNFAAKFHIVGKGFNDPDMLQPPNTLKTVLSPGLTPEESYTQFKLWVVMKSPLVLGVNWAQVTKQTHNCKFFRCEK